jgi:mRNA interferase RelE/StbE
MKYKLAKEAIDFLKKIPTKHAIQIVDKIEKLANDINSIPNIKLEGFKNIRRAKSGEYRIIFRIEDNKITILVLKIGKRNDGEVYKKLAHLDN